jgi:integrase
VTVNIELRSLRATFNVGVKWGVIQENSFAQCKLLRLPEKDPAYLSKDEFNMVLTEAGDDQFRALLVLAVSTMMRRGEIINLEWQDIDFDRRLIHVRNKSNFTVKGRRQRVIPMNERVYKTLSSLRRRTGWVFLENDGRQLNGASVSKRFKRLMRKCELPKSIHFHSLRHTGATWHVQQDVPLYTVQKILGHTSPTVTQIYSHLADQNLRQALERIQIPPPLASLN